MDSHRSNSSERGEHGVRGRRRVDCIGRWESDRAHREIASQLNFFCEQMELIARKGLPA
jgi:hypothetical protein